MQPKTIFGLDDSWSLFLDRDGVINERPKNNYVKNWSEFYFIDGVLDAIKLFSNKFKHIFIITNQQGIGKKIMSEESLVEIHQKMMEEIMSNGGRIDAVYHCPDLATKPVNCRKPGLFMANKAKDQYPDIDFQKSVMVGDTTSDMKFGKNAGMITVFVGDDQEIVNPELIDLRFNSLKEFAFNLSAND